MDKKLREKRAALLVKAVSAGKASQKYFEDALRAHELDTLELLRTDI